MPTNNPRLAVRKSRASGRRRSVLPATLIKRTCGDKIDLLPSVEMDSVWGRRWLECQALLLSDRGGIENCGEGQKILIRRAATLEVELTLMEAKMACEGEGASERLLKAYQTAVNTQRRLLENLGARAPRTVGETSTMEDIVIDQKAELIRVEMERRALQGGSDSLLAQLYRSEEQKKFEERDVTKQFVVILDGEPIKR